jgi:hypothetical protein
MKQYLLSIYQPDGPPPPSVDLDRISRELDVLNKELKESGAWVFADGLFPLSTATVLRLSGDEVLMTDGPYAEGKEHLGGISIINAADLDAALAVGRRLAGITGLPIEVRPFQSGAAIHLCQVSSGYFVRNTLVRSPS